MKGKRKRTKELRKSMFLSLFGIVIFQISIVVGVFIMSDTLNQLNKNAVQVLSNAVHSKTDSMEAQMIEWAKIDKSVEELKRIVAKMEGVNQSDIQQILKDKDKRKLFMQQAVTVVLKNLRETRATESFLILNGEDGKSEKSAIYLRDGNPKDNPSDNADVMAEAGTSSLLIGEGITLDSYWKPKLTVDGESAFYTKPYEAGKKYPDIEASNLGYWSNPFRLHENGTEIIAYSVPLRNEKGQVYGVVGIGINLEYFGNILKQNAISIDSDFSYYMGITEDGNNYKTVLVGGNCYKSDLPSGSTLKLTSQKVLYEAAYLTQKEKIVAEVYPMNLYNSNTPFEQEEWSVAGLVRENVLYQPSKRLLFIFAVAAVISISVSVLGSLLITEVTMRPIQTLMAGVKKISVQKIALPKTGLKEFDDLAIEVERLSASIFKAGSKVADIIEQSNLSLGICEYSPDVGQGRKIFCTKKFMEILELPMGDWGNNYIDREGFHRVIEEFQKRAFLEPEEVEIYCLPGKHGKNRFINLKIIKSEEEEKEDKLYIAMDVTGEIKEKEKIKHERDYDVLTNLYNRRAFSKKISTLMAEGCETGVFSIWDLDNLKFINDTYGHDVGDQYICMFANVIQGNQQPNLLAARMSGDEFAMFLYNEDVEEMCGKMRDIHKQFLEGKLTMLEGSTVSVSISAGMSIYKKDGNKQEELQRYADFAMYEVKKKEKGAISLFNRDSYVKDYILVQGVGELNRILQEEAVQYVFQPIVDIRENKIFGYEALMRPISDILGVPTEFLRLAEAQSKLKKVERMTWFCAIEQFVERMKTVEDKNKYLFVNSIPNQSISEEEFHELERMYGNKLKKIVMEITETVEMEKINPICEQQKSRWCEKWEIQTALDDYGAGYSNSGMLVSGKYDFVKIDRDIISGIDTITKKQKMAATIIEYCHSNNIKVIAEGVETKEELEQVRLLGTDYVQGYYLGKPSFEIQTTFL